MSVLPCPFCAAKPKKSDIGYAFRHARGCWFWRHLREGEHWLHPNDFNKWNNRHELSKEGK